MKVRVSFDLDLPETYGDVYSVGTAYLLYEYGEVPQNLLSAPDEADFPETTLNMVEAVVLDIVKSGFDADADGVLDDWGIDTTHVEVLAGG